jgi:hypothetical protein
MKVDEKKLMIIENSILRKTFGPKNKTESNKYQ